MSQSVTTLPSDDIRSILRQWRSRTLTIILIIVTLVILPAVAATIIRLVEQKELFWVAFLVGMYLILLVMTFYREVNFHLRGYTVLFLGYLGGIFALLIGGPTGDGRLFLTVMPIFAFVLIGLRSGWIATAISLLVYFVFGFLLNLGVLRDALSNWLVGVGNPFEPGFWLMTWAAFAALLLPTITLLDRFYRLLLNSLKAERRASIKQVQAYDSTLGGWARALEVRDHETEGHSRRVTEMCVRLAHAMGLPDGAVIHLYRGALLHDIGKIGVPDGILLKPGPLTEEEWKIMRQHPVLAYQLLSPIEFLQPALGIPYSHHEKWDGTGYPQKLKGEQIPLVARLFAVVDVWDALRSDRPYREAWSEEKTREYIKSLAGTQFDPEVVQAFLNVTGEENHAIEQLPAEQP